MTKMRLKQLSQEFQELFVSLGFEKISEHGNGIYVTYSKQTKSFGILRAIFHDSAMEYKGNPSDLVTVFCNISDTSNAELLDSEGFGWSGKSNFFFNENRTDFYKELISKSLQRWVEA